MMREYFNNSSYARILFVLRLRDSSAERLTEELCNRRDKEEGQDSTKLDHILSFSIGDKLGKNGSESEKAWDLHTINCDSPPLCIMIHVLHRWSGKVCVEKAREEGKCTGNGNGKMIRLVNDNESEGREDGCEDGKR